MQIVTLNLTPGSVAPVVYASQNDDGRVIRFKLVDGDINNSYSLNGLETITAKLTKPDGTETTIAITNPGSGKSYIDLVNGLSDYDQEGVYLGEIVLTRNATVMGTGNFILEVEADAYGSDVEVKSASGIIASFETALTEPLVALKANFLCSGGGGTPSTPIPIVGHSELNLTRCGKNLFDYNELPLYSGYFDGSNFIGTPLEEVNIETVESWRWCYYLIPVSGKSSITLSGFDSQGGTQAVWLFDLDDFTNFQNAFGSYGKNGTHTIPNNAKYLVVPMNDLRSQRTNFPNAQAEYGSTATAYEPYNGQTFTVAFGQTVFGGTYDKAGRLTITWGVVDMGTLNYTYDADGRFFANLNTKALGQQNLLCENYINSPSGSASQMPDNSVKGNDGNTYFYVRDTNAGTDAAAFKTSLSGVMLAYELATPIEVDISPEHLNAHTGVNNVFHDGNGDVELSYLDLKE